MTNEKMDGRADEKFMDFIGKDHQRWTRLWKCLQLKMVALWFSPDTFAHGPFDRCVKLWVVHAPGMPETFSSLPKPQVNNPGMHHGTCVTHVP